MDASEPQMGAARGSVLWNPLEPLSQVAWERLAIRLLEVEPHTHIGAPLPPSDESLQSLLSLGGWFCSSGSQKLQDLKGRLGEGGWVVSWYTSHTGDPGLPSVPYSSSTALGAQAREGAFPGTA